MRRLAILCLLVAGCSSDVTEMLVSVTSDGLELDGLELDVKDPLLADPASTLFSKSVTVCKGGAGHGGCYELPISITLVPGPQHPDHPVRVEVGGIVGSDVVVREAAQFQFEKGQRQKLQFVLYPNCVGTNCAADGFACDAQGNCIDLTHPGSDLGAAGDLSTPGDGSPPEDLSHAAIDQSMPDQAPLTDFTSNPDLVHPSQFGDGEDGTVSFPTPGPTTINQTTTSIGGTQGDTSLRLVTITNFGVGQTLLLHQSQGGGAGAWEINYLDGLDTDSNTARLRYPLAHDYSTGAQAIVVPRYTDVTVGTGATLTAPAWNGITGGILVFLASGHVTVGGSITMDTNGYRAKWHGCSYHNPAINCDPTFGGYAGESAAGPPVVQIANNGAGGGASGAGDCSGGAGGGYGTAGADGTAKCSLATPAGGATDGAQDLNQLLLMGGGGGEGGAKSDCAPAPGGNGGGIILIFADFFTVSGGTVSANGAQAVDHTTYEPMCSGTGCAVGGGGAGGAVRLVTSQAELGASLVTAKGSRGGLEACDGAQAGGTGGDGRIAVRSPSVTGATAPAYFGN
jgi:hypothetical protein